MKKYDDISQLFSDILRSHVRLLRVHSLGLIKDSKGEFVGKVGESSLVAGMYKANTSRIYLSIYDQSIYDENGKPNISVVTERTRPKQIGAYQLNNSNISQHPVDLISLIGE